MGNDFYYNQGVDMLNMFGDLEEERLEAQENRRKAMRWWNTELTDKGKQTICDQVYPQRKQESLTGREIENIYLNHYSLYTALQEEDLRG